MERFLRWLLVGGGALVAGLWLERALTPWTAPWLGAVGLVAAGLVALGAGIAGQIDWDGT